MSRFAPDRRRAGAKVRMSPDDFHDLMRDNLTSWGIRHERVKARLETRGMAPERAAQRRLLDDWAIRCAAGVATLDELEANKGGKRWEALKVELSSFTFCPSLSVTVG